MKFHTILAALLLPGAVAAQEAGDKPQSVPPPSGEQNYTTVLVPTPDTTTVPLTPIAVTSDYTVRIHLRLMNAPLKEAVKQLSEQTHETFVLEDDIPADARVTVTAKNISLDTALNAVTESAGLHWGRQITVSPFRLNKKPGAGSDAKTAPDGKSTGMAIHIGKNLAAHLLQWSKMLPLSSFFQNDNKLYQWNAQDKNFKLYYHELLNKDGSKAAPDSTFQFKKTPLIPGENGNLKWTTPHIETLNGQPTLLQATPGNLSMAYTLGSTLLGATSVNEVRSTFTCPHCKHQVTVIQKHESPKCDKCGRAFHDDWQFCPFDGAKRPATGGADWQFCPICGKSVKDEVRADTKRELKVQYDTEARPKSGL